MKYGHFDDARREYVIDRPDTPLPWVNYLGTRDLIGLISNTAGGYTFYRDARLRRLTRYRYNDVPTGENGRYLYLRDDRAGTYWAPTWQPTRQPLEEYSCRHGLGYTIIRSQHSGIESEATYFIPLGDPVEVWALRLTNHREQEAHISAFSAVEFCLWNAHDDATNLQRNLNIGEVEVHGSTILHKTEYRERRNHFATFTCSERLEGFETQRCRFLGPYRGWDSPVAVEQGQLENSIQIGGAPMGAHHVRLVLKPGETRTIVFVLGYHETAYPGGDPRNQGLDRAAAEERVGRYLSQDAVAEALHALREDWEQRTSVLQIGTCDPHFDRMINTWNAYQTAITSAVSRSASRYESGIGRGIGFRDANQDLLGSIQMRPKRARARILDLAATMLVSGGAYHQYQPLTRKGNDDIGSGFNDDPLWMILSTCAYLKETGDWAVLDEEIAYGDDATCVESLYAHLLRAADYTLDRLGPHGLPLIGRADWNDCLNLNSHSLDPDEPFQTGPIDDGTVAESIVVAGLFCLAGRELVECASRRGDEATAARLSDAVDAMSEVASIHGWDGEWFLRAYDSEGGRVGSRANAEGRIFVEPQGICPMAGIGLDDGHAESALDSVEEYLATEHGILLVQPSYTRYDPKLGEISSYPPGYKENGSVFCHANPWIVIAECMLKRGDRAWQTAARINPSVREAISEIHACEPYVYAQTIVGRDAEDHGRARNSWLTGTASWAYVAATQWILGVRPSWDGLRIDPCLPASMEGFHAVRRFRGATYEIDVDNTSGAGHGAPFMTVDGERVEGNLLPEFADGMTHRVQLRLEG